VFGGSRKIPHGDKTIGARVREVWTNVARSWYSKAADKYSIVGMPYGHIANLARSNALQRILDSGTTNCVGPEVHYISSTTPKFQRSSQNAVHGNSGFWYVIVESFVRYCACGALILCKGGHRIITIMVDRLLN